jgi:hypothetical protein
MDKNPSLYVGAIALVISSGITGCGGSASRSPLEPTSATTNAEYPPPATHRVALPDGGEIVLRFVDFHPPRGGRLLNDQGAYVRVQWEMPRRAVLVSAAGDAWDGARSLRTSFMSSAILFALPVCLTDPPSLLSRSDQFGRTAHSRYEFPRDGDPAVPFVRVRLWVTDWPHGCDGNLPMPPIAAIEASPATLTAIERVDWRR